MPDREKVIKGLAACMPQTEEDAAIGCGGCPYNGNPCSGDYQDNDHVNLPVRLIEDIRALLKAQEPVNPKKNDVEFVGLRTWDWACPECNCILIYRANYCSCCGRAVKWE